MVDTLINDKGAHVRAIQRRIGTERYDEPVMRGSSGEMVSSTWGGTLPDVGESLLAEAITISRDGRIVICWSCSVNNAYPTVQHTRGGVTVDRDLDWGVDLKENAYHEQSYAVKAGDTINFECSDTGGTFCLDVLDPEGVV